MDKIIIHLLSDLCCGNGESTGIYVDSEIVIRASGIPCLPGRRLKGCLKDSALLLKKFGHKDATDENIRFIFGDAFDANGSREGALRLSDAVIPGTNAMEQFLLRQDIADCLRDFAEPLRVTEIFSSIRGQTKINSDGVAEDKSLRYLRVLNKDNPLTGEEMTLEAYADTQSLSPEQKQFLSDCIRITRHLGSNRTRGLGLVSMKLIPDNAANASTAASVSAVPSLSPEDAADIEYFISLESPVTIPGCAEMLYEIPARSVIGCMAKEYLKDHSAESGEFRDLFLNGIVCWSALTPSIGGKRSQPAPSMLVSLKNRGLLANRYMISDAEKKEKQKSLEGAYAVETIDGYQIASVQSSTRYHYARKYEDNDGPTLYMQDSLDAGVIFAGKVSFPAKYAELIQSLIQNAAYFFGRSKTAEYASCKLVQLDLPAIDTPKTLAAKPGDPVFAVLTADLALTENGREVLDIKEIKRSIAEAFGLVCDEDLSTEYPDFCLYHTLGGYQSMWQLQRPQRNVLRAGSTLVFRAGEKPLHSSVVIGDYQQEGFGRIQLKTMSEMAALTEIRRAAVDASSFEMEDSSVSDIRSYLTAELALREIEKRAVSFNDHGNLNNKGLLSRIRLMVQEASDLRDLNDRLCSIKDEEKRKNALDIRDELYGGNALQADAVRMLGDDWPNPEVINLLRSDEKAKSIVESNWKRLIQTVIRVRAYGK